MAKLSYVTAAAEVADPEGPNTEVEPDEIDLFEEDPTGKNPPKLVRTLKAYRPKPARFAMLMSDLQDVDFEDEDSVEPEHFGALTGFVVNIFEGADARYLKKRLRSNRDKFGMEQLSKVFLDLAELWSSHPTESSSDSTSPPETESAPTGPSSSTGTLTPI